MSPSTTRFENNRSIRIDGFLRVLVGCEQFGHTREAFRRRGHYATTCWGTCAVGWNARRMASHGTSSGLHIFHQFGRVGRAYCDPDLDRFGIADDAGFVAPNITGAVHGRHIRNLANRDPAQCRIRRRTWSARLDLFIDAELLVVRPPRFRVRIGT
jgi:hypothetical protein